jgi:hypothetical protein
LAAILGTMLACFAALMAIEAGRGRANPPEQMWVSPVRPAEKTSAMIDFRTVVAE